MPHFYEIGHPLFVTFRLYGSLPRHRSFRACEVTSGEAFAHMDRLLDAARTGPAFLCQPAVAEAVVEALWEGTRLGRYEMHAWVIMPNHVHLLITPHTNLPRLIGALKGVSAHRANQLLGRTGQRFWQEEYYDHLVRDDAGFERIRLYIENNPVRARLARTAEEYRWSSACGVQEKRVSRG